MRISGTKYVLLVCKFFAQKSRSIKTNLSTLKIKMIALTPTSTAVSLKLTNHQKSLIDGSVENRSYVGDRVCALEILFLNMRRRTVMCAVLLYAALKTINCREVQRTTHFSVLEF